MGKKDDQMAWQSNPEKIRTRQHKYRATLENYKQIKNSSLQQAGTEPQRRGFLRAVIMDRALLFTFPQTAKGLLVNLTNRIYLIGINVTWFRQSWFNILNVNGVIFFFNSYAVNNNVGRTKFRNENICLRNPVDNIPCF